MKIIVTGGAGFIGGHLAHALVAAGHEVCVLDNLSGGRKENVPDEAALHVIDIRDRDAVFALFDEFRPDAVSHHAAQASVAISVREPTLDASINVIGSLNVIEAAMRVDVQRVGFASTGGAIYGDVPDGKRAAVGWAPKPMSPYSVSKLAVEGYLRALGAERGLQSVTLRYANVYGPRQAPHGEAGVIAIFTGRLLAGKPLQVYARREPGDGGCIRDYIHVRDVVRMNVAALEGEFDDVADVINVGTGVGTNTRELADRIVELLGSDVVIPDGARRPGDVERSVLEAPLCWETLGELVTLDEGVPETVEWFRSEFEGGS